MAVIRDGRQSYGSGGQSGVQPPPASGPSNNSSGPSDFERAFSLIAEYGQQPSSYPNDPTAAFNGALNNLAGLLGSLMGGGGKGGGKAQRDLADQFGLKRDEITAQRDYLNKQFANSEQDFGFQNQSLDLQNQQAIQNKALANEQLLGSTAARGSTTTAGVGTQQNNLDTQFQNLMSRLGLQRNELNLSHQQGFEKFGYATQRNDFARQGLDISAGQAGLQNPFSNPNPSPLQKK